MKKLLFVTAFLMCLLPNFALARHHHQHHHWGGGCHGCMMPRAYKHWHNHNGWWLPVGVILGASIAAGTQRYYEEREERYYSTPVYYTPNYSNPRTIIIRDTNYPNQVIYETIY